MEFLKGAQTHGNVCFVIACPSWMRDDLRRFLSVSNIQKNCYEIISPKKKPIFLSVYETAMSLTRKIKRRKIKSSASWMKGKLNALHALIGRNIISVRFTPMSLLLGLIFAPLALICIVPLTIGLLLINMAESLIDYYRQSSILYSKWRMKKHIDTGIRIKEKISTATQKPKSNKYVVKLYQLLLEVEAKLMLKAINSRKDIGAWYSPTVFWPSFNNIQGPKLICVPDVVLSNFPVGFAMIDEHNRYLNSLKQVEQTIANGVNFVTYSDDVKWNTLVARYHKDPACISVIRHGANQLNDLIQVSGFSNNERSTDVLSRNLFYIALRRMVPLKQSYFKNCHRIFSKNDMRFIFYASQCRPNKNLLSLLRAYKYLLKERFMGMKLILTGDPQKLPEVSEFIIEHNLTFDVLFLHRLEPQELASCYRLAELAVNPSLSEGGCPFTFTEALSVGTPVVMARIPVTEEVITCPDLQESMLFDPYDWRDMAARIEWGLSNKEVLLQKQQPIYQQLTQRTWKHVVDDYINILEQISAAGSLNHEQKLLIENV